MGISKILRRELTNPKTRGTTTFYASSVYVPVYGKTTFKIGGRGIPGNPATGGTPLGSNPPTGGNASYNPPTGGNYAGSNPNTVIYNMYVTGNNYKSAGQPNNISPPYTEFSNNLPTFQNKPTYTQFNHNAYNAYTQYYAVGLTKSGNMPNYYTTFAGNNANDAYYYVEGYSQNSIIGGNFNYNPTVPGNVFYNPTTPGNPTYNPTVPGNAGANSSVLGVPFPGGAGGALAPVVMPTPVTMIYTPTGVSIDVPAGGYVDIVNT